jgi:hypothetical protein
MTEKITVQEIRTLFGDSLPIEAAALLCEGGLSVDAVRRGLQAMADLVDAEREREACRPVRLLAEWVDELPLQMQAVLAMACRGCDGMPKDHRHKPLLRYFRSFVFKAAHVGRSLEIGEHVGSLMTLRGFDDGAEWDFAVRSFSEVEDELPGHFIQHFKSGAQIIGYMHPDDFVRNRWFQVYMHICKEFLHNPPESMEAMCDRLSDFGRPLHSVLPYTTGEL